MAKLLKILLTIFVLLPLIQNAEAQNISPAMISQLQSLPKAQQQALAKQYGIDLDSITNASKANSSGLGQPGEQLEQFPFLAEMTDKEKAEFYKEQQKSNKKIDEDAPLERYGMALFNRNISTFAPTDNASVPSDYLLGVGDELIIQMFGKENQATQLSINREGEILIPKLGPIKVANLTYQDASNLIQNRVKNQLIGVEAVVSLSQLRAINVFMAGEVTIPGAYSVSGLSTVSQALFQSGGVTDIGSLRNIQVRRNNQTIATFDLYELLMNGDASNDVRLHSGDVVFVPPYETLVTVEGEVKRSMQYEAVNTDTVASVLNMAGGLKSSALKSKIVHIQNPESSGLPQVNNIDLNTPKSLAKSIKDGDKLIVLPVSEALENSVVIHGAVARPGEYGWSSNARVSDLVSDMRRDLIANVDLNYAFILREKTNQLDVEVVQFKPIDIFLNRQTDLDPLLKPNDEIYFFTYVEVSDEEDTSIEEELAKKEREKAYESLLANTGNNPGNTSQISNNVARDTLQGNPFSEGQMDIDYFVGKKSKLDRETILEPVIKKLKSLANTQNPVQVVSISGAVKEPGEYPLAVDATVKDLVLAAGGFKDSAFLPSLELRRLERSSESEVNVTYKELDLTKETDSQTLIQSRDHINVRLNDDWNRTDSITITGEVKFPGTYLIQPGESITGILQRAGGLKEGAFPEAAVFKRKEIATLETQRALGFADSLRRDFASSLLTDETVTVSYQEIALITQKLELFEGQGRLLINLQSALDGDVAADIEVINGDELFIPKRSNTVTVVGEVRKQGTHTYQTGFDLDEYIALSAGLSPRGDDNAIYIVRANGSVVIPETSLTLFQNNIENIKPGDTIVVPIDSQHKESISFWRDITQIVYQGTVAIAAVARL